MVSSGEGPGKVSALGGGEDGLLASSNSGVETTIISIAVVITITECVQMRVIFQQIIII